MTTEKKETTKAPAAAAAPAKKSKGFVIAPGVSITRGSNILPEGTPVTPKDVDGGEAAFKLLVDRGLVVEAQE